MKYARWIALCAMAEFLGIGAAALWYGGANVLLGEPQPIAARVGAWIVMTLAAVPEGLILGGLQAIGLRWFFRSVPVRRWIVATTAVGLIGWAIGTFIPLFVVAEHSPQTGPEPGLATTASFAALFGLAIGTVLGLAQALVLPAGPRGKLALIIANSIGWAVALPMIYVAVQIGADFSALPLRLLAWVIGGLAGGIAIGFATASALRILE